MAIDQKTIDYIKQKGLKTGFSYKDVWQNEHGVSFTVAKVMEVDVLQDIKSAVTEAITEGKTLAQFKKDLKPILSEKGWWGEKFVKDPKTGEYVKTDLSNPRRLKTIFNSNVRSARSAGQWQRAQLTKKFAPYFVYELGPSQHHREQHAEWENKVLPIDNPFWDYAMPPNGWGCKCYVTQITEEQASEYGGESQTPTLEFNEYKNNRTDRVYKVLKGCDPAWSSNAGKFRNKVISESFEDKLLTINAPSAKYQVQAVVKSNYFINWWNNLASIQTKVKDIPNRQYNWQPIAYIANQDVYDKPVILRLSEETAYNTKVKHDSIKAEDYQKVQEIVDKGNLTANTNNPNYFKITHTIDNNYYKLGFKRTNNNEYIMTNFHKNSK